MASFVYNVYDNNTDTPTNCYFQFYHTDTNKLSNVRQSIDNQLSFDSDDADINNQEAPFKKNNIGILMCWTGSNNRANILNKFIALKIVSTGTDVYTGDVILKSSVKPSGFATISNGLVNSSLTINIHATDNYQFNDTNKHFKNWYSIEIFKKVDIKEILYDFGKGYQSLNSFTWTESGSYVIHIKIINYYDQEFILEETVNIYNIPPTAILGCNPQSPKLNEQYLLSSDIQNTEFIKSTKYFLNNNEITSNDFEGSFTEIKTNPFILKIVYFDGFNNVELEWLLNIQMIKKSPVLILSNIDQSTSTDSIYEFTSTIAKGDGNISKVIYNLFMNLPFNGNKTFIMSYEKIIKTDENAKNEIVNTLNIEFLETGTYTLIAKAIDEYGKYSTDTNSITIACTNRSNNNISDSAVFYFDKE